MRSSVLETNWLQVDKIEIPAGELMPQHEGKVRLVVALSDYTIEFQEIGSEKVEKSWQRGDVHWHLNKKHSVKNIGQTPARFLIITSRGSEAPTKFNETTHEHGEGSLLPQKVFENESVLVSKVVLKPGQKQPPHFGGKRAIIALSDYQIKYRSDLINEKQVSLKNESVHVHEADTHSVENVGDTVAEYLVVQFNK